MSLFRKSSIDMPPVPTTKAFLGWNCFTNAGSPEFVERRPLFTSIAVISPSLYIMKSTSRFPFLSLDDSRQ